jgi:hypothetical protein
MMFGLVNLIAESAGNFDEAAGPGHYLTQSSALFGT